MIKPNFEKSLALATELLYKQNIKNRILNIQNLDYGNKRIVFDTIQNYAQIVKKPLSDFYRKDKPILKDGCLIIDGDTYFIFYNAEITYWEHLNWTLAHEIGHIYLEHKKDGPIEEIEAHFFAAQLLMPEYSILRMSQRYGIVSEIDLMEIFGVSKEAAKKRLVTMSKKTWFHASNMDKEIWGIQSRRIDIYYDCLKDPFEYRNYLEYMLYQDELYEQEMLWQLNYCSY